MKIFDHRKRTLKKRILPVKAVVVHNTGEQDEDQIVKFYDLGKAMPHYFITYLGAVYQFVDEGQIAYHCGMRTEEIDLYQRNVWRAFTWPLGVFLPYLAPQKHTAYAEWDQRWPGLASPMDVLGTQRTNGITVGIELQNPTSKIRTQDQYTDPQYHAASELIACIAARHGLMVCQSCVVGHYDLSPLRRATVKRGNWDPGPINWKRLGVDA